MDFRGIYNLHMAAHGNEAIAKKARARALELYVDWSCKNARK